MSIFIWMLLAVQMDGSFVAIDTFRSSRECSYAVEYIQSLDKRLAHVYCVRVSLKEV